jgi:hypothetical protein
MLDRVFLTSNGLKPNMTWAAALPKGPPKKPDSLSPNPDGFMELRDLPLMLDMVSMLQVDQDRIVALELWLK